MHWQLGIDEAGYGPNLGPFVMTLVALRVPGPADDPWDLLRACVRRHGEEDEARLIVADSKLVYNPTRGLSCLETTVLNALYGGFFATAASDSLCVGDLLGMLAPDDVGCVAEECWYLGTTALPLRADAASLWTARTRLEKAARKAKLAWGCCRSAVVCAPRFNDLVDRWDSKGIVPTLSLVRLIRAGVAALPDEPLRFVIDKQGGRNQYSAMLQEAFPGGIVLAREEGRDRSAYTVEGLGRPVEVVFVPRADAEHFTVALASMVSKYVREALMAEFNAFWATHLPALEPTAGYPGDAARFFDDIRPVLGRLGLSERQVWRQR